MPPNGSRDNLSAWSYRTCFGSSILAQMSEGDSSSCSAAGTCETAPNTEGLQGGVALGAVQAKAYG
jgi:hypothetical protein